MLALAFATLLVTADSVIEPDGSISSIEGALQAGDIDIIATGIKHPHQKQPDFSLSFGGSDAVKTATKVVLRFDAENAMHFTCHPMTGVDRSFCEIPQEVMPIFLKVLGRAITAHTMLTFEAGGVRGQAEPGTLAAMLVNIAVAIDKAAP